MGRGERERNTEIKREEDKSGEIRRKIKIQRGREQIMGEIKGWREGEKRL